MDNVAGLRYLAKEKNRQDYNETAFFIEVMTLCSTAINVKTIDKGFNRLDLLSQPIDSRASESIHFLQDFENFLIMQAPLKNKFLTCQTYKSSLLT